MLPLRDKQQTIKQTNIEDRATQPMEAGGWVSQFFSNTAIQNFQCVDHVQGFWLVSPDFVNVAFQMSNRDLCWPSVQPLTKTKWVCRSHWKRRKSVLKEVYLTTFWWQVTIPLTFWQDTIFKGRGAPFPVKKFHKILSAKNPNYSLFEPFPSNY